MLRITMAATRAALWAGDEGTVLDNALNSVDINDESG
jgi:hypothetical protein